jgi:hypothetical protein
VAHFTAALYTPASRRAVVSEIELALLSKSLRSWPVVIYHLYHPDDLPVDHHANIGPQSRTVPGFRDGNGSFWQL